MSSDPTILSRRHAIPVVIAVLAIAWGCGDQPTAPDQPAISPSADLSSSSTVSFRSLNSNTFNSCGVTSDDRIFCWPGNNQLHGQFVNSSLKFRQVSVGNGHVCALTEDDLAYCWGENFDAQLGDGTLTARATPVGVLGGHHFLTVQAGGQHTCGLTLTHDAFCWGRKAEGQGGDGSTVSRRFRPVPVAGDLKFLQIVAGQAHNCGATSDHRGFCWGYAADGQIGDGKVLRLRNTPRAVIGGLSFRFLSAGNSHSCGLTTSNFAYCW